MYKLFSKVCCSIDELIEVLKLGWAIALPLSLGWRVRLKATALDAFWGQRYEDFLDIQKLLLNFAAHIKYNDYEEVSFTGNHCTHYLHDSCRAKHVQRLNRPESNSQGMGKDNPERCSQWFTCYYA